MKAKDLSTYASEMDAKFNVKQNDNRVIETREDLLKVPSKKLLQLVEALKEDIDFRLFRCYNKRFYMYGYNWFDIYIEVYFNIKLLFDIYLSEKHYDWKKVSIIMTTFVFKTYHRTYE